MALCLRFYLHLQKNWSLFEVKSESNLLNRIYQNSSISNILIKTSEPNTVPAVYLVGKLIWWFGGKFRGKLISGILFWGMGQGLN